MKDEMFKKFDTTINRSSTATKQKEKKKVGQDRKSMGSGSSSEGEAMYWTSSFFLT